MFGVRPTARRARWLATRIARDAWHLPHVVRQALIAGARDRLHSVSDLQLQRHRAASASSPELSRLRSALPQLAQEAQEACDAATLLESQIPPGAVEEQPARWLLLPLLLGLLTEGAVTFQSLGGTSLGDSPLTLLCASLISAPLAAVMLRRAGVLLRRSVWKGGRIAPTDAIAILVSLAIPMALGYGLTVARVDAVGAARTTALLVSGSLQAVLLGGVLLEGYVHASPVAGMARARRRRARAIRAHDRAAAALHRLIEAHREQEVHVVTAGQVARAEFDHQVQRLLGAVGPVPVSQLAVASSKSHR